VATAEARRKAPRNSASCGWAAGSAGIAGAGVGGGGGAAGVRAKEGRRGGRPRRRQRSCSRTSCGTAGEREMGGTPWRIENLRLTQLLRWPRTGVTGGNGRQEMWITAGDLCARLSSGKRGG